MQAAFCAVYCSSSIVCTLRFVSQHKFIKIGLNNIKMLRKHNYGRSELYLKCIRILSLCFLGPSLLFKGSRAELSCVCHAMLQCTCVPGKFDCCERNCLLSFQFSLHEKIVLNCLSLKICEAREPEERGLVDLGGGGGTRDMKKIN